MPDPAAPAPEPWRACILLVKGRPEDVVEQLNKLAVEAEGPRCSYPLGLDVEKRSPLFGLVHPEPPEYVTGPFAPAAPAADYVYRVEVNLGPLPPTGPRHAMAALHVHDVLRFAADRLDPSAAGMGLSLTEPLSCPGAAIGRLVGPAARG